MPFPAMISLLVSFFPKAELRVELIDNCTSSSAPSPVIFPCFNSCSLSIKHGRIPVTIHSLRIFADSYGYTLYVFMLTHARFG